MSSERATLRNSAVITDGIVRDLVTEACDRMTHMHEYSDIKWTSWPRHVEILIGAIIDADDLAFGAKL
jgi:hypothetical protein